MPAWTTILNGLSHIAEGVAGGSEYLENYSPLDANKREIRLLRIQPNSYRFANSPLEILMRTVSLESAPNYDALSYTWENPTGLRLPVQINGKLQQISLSLGYCLLQFRKEKLDGELWIDALCINQQDRDERGQQVSMMRDIYRQAGLVRVWLGPARRTSRACFDELKRLNSDTRPDSLADYSYFNKMSDVVERKWFTRLWVVQEVKLANRVVVHCGDSKRDFDELLEQLRCLSDLVERSRKASLSQTHDLLGFRRGYIDFKHAEFEFLLQALQPVRMCFDRVQDLSAVNSDPQDVINQLALVSPMRTTLPQDQIYGILGLLPTDLAIQPDYNDPLPQVYEDCARRILSWSRSLDLLTFAGSAQQEKQPYGEGLWIHDWCVWAMERALETKWLKLDVKPEPKIALPSWVPRWNQRCTFYLHHRYDAAKGLSFWHQEGHQSSLYVKALFLDSVSTVGRVCHDVSWPPFWASARRPEARSVICSWRDLYANHGQDDAVAFWRTFTGDQLFDEETASYRPWRHEDDAHIPTFDKWVRSRDMATESEYLEAQGARKLTGIDPLMRAADLRFFITKENRIGTVRANIRGEEVVALIAGLHMPALLRATPEKGKDAYEFVAVCYCDGVMWGDAALQSGQALNDTESELQEIVLI